jgi:hypothetical protein
LEEQDQSVLPKQLRRLQHALHQRILLALEQLDIRQI